MATGDSIKKTLKKIKTAADTTLYTLTPIAKSPDEQLGDLFSLVQLERIHPDGMVFVNQIPSVRLRTVIKAYEKASKEPGFDLAAFVKEHFKDLPVQESSAALQVYDDPEEHIKHLWDTLTRKAPKAKGSQLPLPNPYIVPGGRFQEQFYWDSYFTMLGLEASKRHDLTDGMMANFAYEFRKIGFIPTGNRTYYTTRSQPPYYYEMARLVAKRKGKKYLFAQLPYLIQEQTFWTKDTSKFIIMRSKRYKREVRMPDGSILNRYWDAKNTPRPESFKEDFETAEKSDRPKEVVYRHLRAGAESGWDFTSRWLEDPMDLSTIRTTEIVPIDLNCMIYELELAIAEIYRGLLQPLLARHYERRAEKRREAINTYLWDEEKGYYFDYHQPTQSRTPVYSIAAAHALFCGVATPEQAEKVAEVIRRSFLQPGGVVMTLHTTGEQWDAPNGWAPLQWITIVGLRRYGFDELADTIKNRWLATNLAVFKAEHKFVEKYNVADPTSLGGGGEYELQDGFGWTNGVFMALRHDLDIELGKK
jgi:alpha,alpha-trehalase